MDIRTVEMLIDRGLVDEVCLDNQTKQRLAAYREGLQKLENERLEFFEAHLEQAN